MVRRGSTVRVRQRVSRVPQSGAFSFRSKRRVLERGRAWKALWKIQVSEPSHAGLRGSVLQPVVVVLLRVHLQEVAMIRRQALKAHRIAYRRQTEEVAEEKSHSSQVIRPQPHLADALDVHGATLLRHARPSRGTALAPASGSSGGPASSPTSWTSNSASTASRGLRARNPDRFCALGRTPDGSCAPSRHQVA